LADPETTMSDTFPLGKLPPDVLASLLARFPNRDSRVLIGPRPGEDAAVIDLGAQCLVAKTDPITFASDEIGWYAVNVNANDIATMGATPQWFMTTLLLPEGRMTRPMIEGLFEQIRSACEALDVTMVGGHTEVTYGIERPIVVGMMLGTVARDKMITTGGAQIGDALIVTKGVPIEATALIARDRAEALRGKFSDEFLSRCAGFLHQPGISVVRDAAIALGAGRVHAMHDPTEGGLITGLWEMAEAANHRLRIDPSGALLEEGRALCEAVGIDPLGAIASGALLIAAHPDDGPAMIAALEAGGIHAFHIGQVEDGPILVTDRRSGQTLPRPLRDEIARLFE
jgi:hydrogenase expression/formation protein HypE